MRVIVANSYIDDKRIIMGVVKTLGIFFREPNDRVVNSRHLWYETCQLDVVNHPEVSFAGLFGRTGSCCAPYDHSYISYGWSGTLIILSGGLLLGRQIRPFHVDELL